MTHTLPAPTLISEATAGVEASFDRITRLLAHLTDAPVAAFSPVRPSGPLIRPASVPAMVDVMAGDSLFARACLAQGGVLTVADVNSDSRFRGSPAGIRFYAGMPVRAPDGTAVGILFIADAVPRQLTPAMEAALYSVGAAIEEVIRQRILSVQDPVTGLHNRRFFDELLEREWVRARRDGSDVSVIMFDVDRFKAYNDRLGHLAGDRCLRSVASALREGFQRPGDVVARYGGEEFVVLLPGTPARAGMRLADDARRRVRDLSMPNPGATRGLVTVSAGVAGRAPGVDDYAETLLADADAALYAAKSAGRDAVHMWPADGLRPVDEWPRRTLWTPAQRSEAFGRAASRQAESARLLRKYSSEDAARRAERGAAFARIVAEDEKAVGRMLSFARQLNGVRRLQPLLERALDHALMITDADFGNIQLVDGATGALTITAQQGFDREFLDYFSTVDDGAACGRAARSLSQTMIADVDQDAGFRAHRAIAAASGFRAVQSTPLVDGRGRLLGVVSTHYRTPGAPAEIGLRLLEHYAMLLAAAACDLR